MLKGYTNRETALRASRAVNANPEAIAVHDHSGTVIAWYGDAGATIGDDGKRTQWAVGQRGKVAPLPAMYGRYGWTVEKVVRRMLGAEEA